VGENVANVELVGSGDGAITEGGGGKRAEVLSAEVSAHEQHLILGRGRGGEGREGKGNRDDV
jgi:hypothetical protein